MKKCFWFLSLLFVLFIFGCGKTIDPAIGDKEKETSEEQKVESVEMLEDDIVLALDQTYTLHIKKSDNASYSYNYDNKVIQVLDDVIIPSGLGETKLSLVFNDKVVSEINVLIYEKPKELKFLNTTNIIKIDEEIELLLNSKDVRIELSNNNGTFDKETYKLKGVNSGEIVVTAYFLYDETLFTSKTFKVISALVPADFVYVDGSVTAKLGEEVSIDGYLFTFGTNLFNTIEDALDVSKEIVVGSTEEEVITICDNDVVIEGKQTDSPLDLQITIASGVKNVTIKGLTLTGDVKILLANSNSNITITGNTFIDTTKSTKTWVADNKYTYGIIELTNCTNYHNNIVITNNIFKNIGECGINVSTTHNIIIKGNRFEELYRDGIRFNNGIIKEDATWSIVRNTFIDSNYSGIYFRTYGSDSTDIYHYVDVKENTFSSLGKGSEEFSGAIVFRNYQEGGACVDIAYNTFSGCSKYIFLRNNAVKANQPNFVGYVIGNVFETVPSKYYFNNLNSSDSFSTNPKQTKLVNNAYLNNGKDIKPNDSLFIGNANNTTLSLEKVKALYHFELHHVLKVDKVTELLDDVVAVDSDKFEISANKIKALESGTYYLKHNEDSFEVHCIKNIEMVVRFINIALGEVGYEEMDANGNTGTSGNYTKYGAWYGINPGAWCAMYVSWCANQAGVPTSIIPKYASVQIGMDWYKNKNLFQYKENYTPKAGDIMFMKSNGASHTGIVLYCDGKTLYTVEGNTSDKCALRKYDVNNAKITGYGTPEWPYYSPNGYNFSSGEAQDGSGHSTT